MANDLSVIEHKILARGLLALRQQVIMPRLVNNSYSTDAAQKGDVVNVPIPVAQAASAVTPAAVPPTPASKTPTNVQIALDQWYHSDFHLTDKELTEVDKNQHFFPMQASEAIKALANQVNVNIMSNYLGVYGYHGTAGTTPFGATPGVSDATNVRKILNQQLCPKSDRRLVLDYDAEENALVLAAFSDLEKTGDQKVKIEGVLGRKYGFDIAADDHAPLHTAGTITTGLIVKASTVHAVGATSIVCTTAASTGACALLTGDIILIAGDSQTYVLTADATETAAATDVTLSISPPLKVATAGSEAVTVKASHRVNLAFHRDAFAFATRPLMGSLADLQLGSRILSMQDPVSGIVLRLEIMREFKQTVWDFDILWGSKLVRAELACRLAG
uniref:Putative capsid protein n=2 Tax=viral metagenome TaxID=1070528 RepID=A0A6M3JB63_9ZZZZ